MKKSQHLSKDAPCAKCDGILLTDNQLGHVVGGAMTIDSDTDNNCV